MNVCVNVRKERERREPLYRAREGERPQTWAVNHQMGEPSTKKCTRSLGLLRGLLLPTQLLLSEVVLSPPQVKLFPHTECFGKPVFRGNNPRATLKPKKRFCQSYIAHRPHLKA